MPTKRIYTKRTVSQLEENWTGRKGIAKYHKGNTCRKQLPPLGTGNRGKRSGLLKFRTLEKGPEELGLGSLWEQCCSNRTHAWSSEPREESPQSWDPDLWATGASSWFLEAVVLLVLRVWRDSELEPPALLELAAAAKVKNVAEATLIGTESKQRRKSPSPTQTFKLSAVATLIGAA